MKKIIAKSKNLRHKYKRYAAVLAGAAIMAGTSLPGIPATKVAASEVPDTSPPITTEQVTTVNNDQPNFVKQFIANKTNPIKRLNRGWHEHIGGWPSSEDNQGWVENGHIYYRHDKDHSDEYNNALSSPVEFVKEYASLYGFDPDNDIFTLLSESNGEATVQVVKSDTGQRFKVDLENHLDWRIVAIRGIGDMNHPATYHSTRGFYPY
ncbi:MAG: hypothetical protein H6Q68_3580 [Firmicutes bacterium]|nr:hypothetical protein [Bacillota bacterium]